MKNITKLSLIAATLAIVGTSAAFAEDSAFTGDSRLQNPLVMERQAAERNQVVHIQKRGIRQKEMQTNRTKKRFELRTNPHGSVYGVYVPAR